MGLGLSYLYAAFLHQKLGCSLAYVKIRIGYI